MKNKSTTSLQHSQHLIAGLLKQDCGIEFFGIPETMEVQWLQKGKVHSFKKLTPGNYAILVNAYISNPEARKHISCMVDKNGSFISLARQVEIYTYFMYGGLDGNPDLVNDELQEPENYRHSRDCISLKFKKIKLNGSPLKPREVQMIDLFMEDDKDDVIAEKMGIAVSTYNQHKKELFTKTGLHTKTAIAVAAVRQRVARSFKRQTV
jgi:DNA-binding CsgD family transcriptional regulator